MFRAAFASPPQHTFKLYYFPIRGRAEFIRMMCAYLDLKFEDHRVRMDEWHNFKGKTPMGGLPVMEVDGKETLCQATAIGRYLARVYGLAGKGNIEMAQADMLVDGTLECWEKLQTVYQDQQKGDIQLMVQSWAQYSEKSLKIYLERYQGFLEDTQSGWLVGNSVTWADFCVAEFLSVLRDCFTPDALDQHSSLIEYMERVLSLPRVKEYIAKRERTPI